MHSRTHLHENKDFGARASDALARVIGSWRFLIVQTIVVTAWIGANCFWLVHPFDPFPLILLNLLFSTQAAYAAPIIMMSQNRQATVDRRRDDHESEEVELLYKINLEQIEILRTLHDHHLKMTGGGDAT